MACYQLQPVFEPLEPRRLLAADPVISEIMYHPASENVLEEYVELFNRGADSVDLGGWRLTGAVQMTLPEVTVAPGEYLVVAADQAAFAAKYPEVANVVAPWQGQLSNHRETIKLTDGTGTTVDSVTYADEGDWAVRAEGPEDNGSRGWTWLAEHDGGGKSLELINPAMPNDYGQNWSASLIADGSPGEANSVAAADSPPLILDVIHAPIIPRASDPVTVTARVVDAVASDVTATLRWRVDAAPEFSALVMHDDGRSGDGAAGDGVFAATIPAQPDGTVVEFFVAAHDLAGHARTWPAPTQPSGQQEANLLYQVIDSFDSSAPWQPGSPVIYHEIMTAAERNEFTNITRSSDAQMNATFISVTGTGIEVRYNAGVRIRGSGSRNHNPPNNRINLPSDRPWHGVDALNINTVATRNQIAGSALFRLAGLPAADARAAILLSNGVNLNNGRPYAHLEPLNRNFTANHFPQDNSGNLYKGRRPNESPPGGQGAGLVYFGPDPAPYVSYTKLTNASAADWSDVINLTYQLNEGPDETYVADVTQVADVDQWLRFFALNALIDNNEGGLVNGDRQGDDYAMYRGVDDTRFRMIPHDLDTLFGRVDRSFFRATNVPALNRLIHHPDFLPRYYDQLIDLAENVLLTDHAKTTLDEVLRNVATPTQIANIKTFLADRAAFVLARIPRELSVETGLPVVGEFPRTTDPALSLSGTADAAKTRSVLVNGQPVADLPGDGTWSLTSTVDGAGSETLVSRGSTWKYLDDGSDQGQAWRDSGFDDSAWPAGPAPLGYGDGNEATVVGYIDTTPEDPGQVTKNATTYFRQTFQVTDAADIVGLHIRLRYDDAAAVYINGVEATRTSNLPADASFNTYANVDTPDEDGLFDFSVTAAALAALVDGPNTIAVELHQGDARSSDIKLDLELTANRGGQVVNGQILNPGINRVLVEAFDGRGGTGNLLASQTVDIWYDGPAANTTLPGPAVDVDHIDLTVRDTYLPGTPLLIRAAALDSNDRIQRDLWDATVTLETDRPDVTLSTNQVTLVNGLGSALVDVTGSGDFTLIARRGDQVVSRRLVSLAAAPETTVAGGTLDAGTTVWSGRVHVTGNVTVPAGATLSIAAGTLILLDGAPVGATDSTAITVHGRLESFGTTDRPVTLTTATAADIWGQIDVDGGTATLDDTVIHRAGNAPHMGHTSSGAAIRVRNQGRLDFSGGSISDLRGKVLQATGGDVTITDALLSRAASGPEIQNTSLLFRDSWIVDMAGIYRPDEVADDDDGIYLHGQQAGQSIALSGGVIAFTEDDGIDTLGAVASVDNMIVRNVFDKAVSTFDGDVTITRSLLVSADIGVNTKGTGTATPHTTIERTTIADVNLGIMAQDKDAPDPDVVITFDVANSIIDVKPGGDAVSTDYDPADIHITYSNVAEVWPGLGNLNADPRFNNAAAGDFRLQPGSASIDVGAPSAAPDADGTRADQGFYGNGIPGTLAPTTITGGTISADTILTPADGPYHITGDLVVAPTARLTILPGTTVYFDAGVDIRVEGVLTAVGSPYQRIRLTSVPDAPLVPDLPGLPDGPPRWSGIHFHDTLSAANQIRYADIDYAQSSNGSIGVVDSQLLIDNVTWRGTHRRIVYGNRVSLEVRNSVFPDMFAADESPLALGLDNVSEHIKIDGGILDGGQLIIAGNLFGTNKGHNDVIDVVSGRRPDPITQILDNVFLGAGDELLDLGGDAYIAGNQFAHVHKDADSSDRGYANAISTGDAGPGTTIVVARNVFWDVDHAVNLKRDTALIFENNTVVQVHDDFTDRFGRVNVGAAINLYVDEPASQPGTGAYVEGNIFWDAPRIFGNADRPPGTVSELALNNNLLSAELAATSVGDRPGSVLDLGTGNRIGDPRLTAAAAGDFTLRPGSPATAAGPVGGDLGSEVPAGVWVSGEPAATTAATQAELSVGGPGMFAFKYRVDGGEWSQPIAIGNGFDPAGDTVRTAQITLTDLANGPHQVELVGQDFAGRWQTTPTQSLTWTVDTTLASLQINEVLAINSSAVDHEGTSPDLVELVNRGALPVDMAGMRLTDDVGNPDRFTFPAGTVLLPGEYLTLYADSNTDTTGLHLGFALDGSGDELHLLDAPSRGGTLLDSVSFGPQIADLSIGRVGHDAQWQLTQPTFGAVNLVQPTGDRTRVVINEWLASGNVRLPDDFVELFNQDTLPVALDGMMLSDKPDAIADKFVFAPLSFVAGNGLRAMIADGHEERGGDHVGFKISADQGLLGLFDPSGRELDRILYAPQTTDFSQGLSPDDGTGYAFFGVPTPGLPALSTADTTTLVALDWDATWRYDDSGTDLGTSWRDPSFDDIGWASGPGLLGVDADPLPEPIQTPLAIGRVTHYFRKHFNLDADPADVTAKFWTIIDDGAVVYVNGQEVARQDLPAGDISYGTTAVTVTVADVAGPWTIPSTLLVEGDNVIAVELHQNSAASADAVFGLSLEITTESFDPAAEQLSALIDGLRVTEVMYHPADAAGVDYVELQNVGSQPLPLDGTRLEGGIDFVFPPMTLAPSQYVVVTEDLSQFQQFYGSGKNVAGQYAGKLSNVGDQIVLLPPEPFDAAILRFKFRDTWYPSTDGGGVALEVRDTAAAAAAWQEPSNWQAGSVVQGTPGYDSESEPAATIVVNEVLTHTDLPLLDAIELKNVTDQPIDIGGWFLSDSATNFQKFVVPSGTVIAAGDYLVFDENDFNPTAGGSPNDFSLNGAHGDQVWLWQGDADGRLTQLADFAEFDAAANGEAFGRWPDGSGWFTPMANVTLGSANSDPRVGPVVMSEIHYHPAPPSPAALAIDPNLDQGDLEFIELYNTAGTTADLSGWQIRGGVDFDFAPGTAIAGGETLVVVPFDPEAIDNASRLAAFRAEYALDTQVRLVGGYAGQLSNGGEHVRLLRADEPPVDEPTFVPRLLEDATFYDDQAPWPTAADGGGQSLTRVDAHAFGPLASSWIAADPSPGTTNLAAPGDVNGDGQVNGLDVDPFVTLLLDGTYQPAADMNQDGEVNGLDVKPFVAAVVGGGSPAVGDVNRDDQVNGLDVAPFVDVVVAGQFDTTADINRDGSVDGLDVDPFVDTLLTGSFSMAADVNRDGLINGLDVAPFATIVAGSSRSEATATAGRRSVSRTEAADRATTAHVAAVDAAFDLEEDWRDLDHQPHGFG